MDIVSRVAKKRHKLISEGKHVFIWPAGASSADWNLARFPADKKSSRPVDEIPNAELIAFAKAYSNSAEPVEDIKHALGFARLKTPAKERIKKALASLIADGGF